MVNSGFAKLWKRSRYYNVCALMTFALCGCGGGSKVPTATVSGVVTFKIERPKGEIAVNGINRQTRESCIGIIDDDGRCEMQFGNSTQIPVGTYDLALISAQPPMSQEEYTKMMKREIPMRKPLILPRKYTDAKKTGWSVEVTGTEATFAIAVGP